MIELGISKVIPSTARPTRDLTIDAARASGQVPTFTDAPAGGARPEPGPTPAPSAPSADEHDVRRQPLRWQIPYAINQQLAPRRGRLLPFETLRAFADISDLVRICIETRKEQMTGLAWNIVPRDKSVQVPKGSDLEGKINLARQLFQKPDKRRSFYTWLGMAIEDVLVIDALSIYKRKTRGGDLFALEVKDGATFLPLLDAVGDTPVPPAIAYRQIIYGQPVQGGDCTAEQLLYRPRTVRSHTPYGLSPTEAVLLTINAAINRQVFNLQYYADGNVPEGLAELPKGWTTEQIAAYQEYFDALMLGNPAMRKRLKFVAEGGSKVFQFKQPEWSTDFDEWLAVIICAAFGVVPAEIGLTSDINKATAGMQENVTYRRGVRPLMHFFKDIFDEVLALDIQAPELQFIFTGGEPEDKKMQAETDAIYVAMGKTSVDELRQRDGQAPIGLGPYVETPMGPIFVDELLAEPDPDDDPATTDRGDKPVATGSDGTDDSQERPFDDDELEDVKKWRAVAIKAVKSGKPVRPFVSDAISPELHIRITRFLEAAGKKGALEVAGVVAAFECALTEHVAIAKASGGERRRMTKVEKRAAAAYQRLMQKHFKAQGKALTEHLAKGIADLTE